MVGARRAGSDAIQTQQVNAGDKLYAYVYLDPAKTPSEVMLQWNDCGGWERRAYWGSNNMPYGTDGTESRRYVGLLPAAGGWVMLEVPASAVGLEGKTLVGMDFSLYGGGLTRGLPRNQFWKAVEQRHRQHPKKNGKSSSKKAMD